MEKRQRSTAIIFAFILGGFGGHKFYLGEKSKGIIYLLFFWTFIPAIIAYVEFFILLCMSDKTFDKKYN